MRKARKNVALIELYKAANQVHRAIRSREEKIAQLQDEIRDLRDKALNPIERLAEQEHEATEARSQWISEPIYAAR